MSTPKELGNEQFKAKNFEKAIEHYTQAIAENPTDHTIYGNRSASYHNLKQYIQALQDGEKCVEMNPSWGKGFQRKAMALHGLNELQKSYDTYEAGLKVDPNNAQIKSGMQSVMRDQQAEAFGGGPNTGFRPQQPGGMGGMGGMGGGMGGLGGMFGGPEAEAKLKANPRIAKYFEDPQFQGMWMMCQQKPEMLMQLVQSDPRFMDVFKELTGVDLMDVQEKQMKKDDQDKEAKKKREAEMLAKQAEDARIAKEKAEAELPAEEREKLEKKKQAEADKAKGNDFYKKKDFDNALKYYQLAIDQCPEEMVYYSNKAAVYFEMKDYENCIKYCDDAAKQAEGGNYDYVKLAKALARKGNAYLQLKQYDESIAQFQKALLENQDHGIKMQLQKAQKAKKDADALSYIDPAIAEEHRLKGNELFKEGSYPKAIKEYEEGLRRDPSAVAIFSNRCATYIKLMEFNTALKDADKCLELDPKFVKAYARKGTCHHFMKEYHKALKSFEDGLNIDPANKDCLDGKNKTMMAIQSSAGAGGPQDEERLQHAMADPEIQQIMRDPKITNILKDMSENPQTAMKALKDPYVADCINKLVAAGVVKMG